MANLNRNLSRKIKQHLPVMQSRLLEDVYAVVFMDTIHFHVQSEGQIVKKAVYIAIGINMDGMKEVLGMWGGKTESAKFWLSVMNGLKSRGLQDILIACVDRLTGFPQAIKAVYPKTEIQQCISIKSIIQQNLYPTRILRHLWRI